MSGDARNAPLLTHCQHEFIQAVWVLLLNEDFKDAYHHGMVITCADGITQRVYLQLVTYSADYPEKYISYFCLKWQVDWYLPSGCSCSPSGTKEIVHAHTAW